MCFSVLQNERGLSCHFLIDNDGTIYQTIDLALMAYHAAEWNIDSIGVELCNRGDAKKEPNYYSSGKYGPSATSSRARSTATRSSRSTTRRSSTTRSRGSRARCSALLPNLPAEFPQSSAGRADVGHDADASASFGVLRLHRPLPPDEPEVGSGPVRLQGVLQQAARRVLLPGVPARRAEEGPGHARSSPSKPSELKDDAERALQARTSSAPTAGSSRSGRGARRGCGTAASTSPAKDGAPVFAPFPGRLVAARMGAELADRLGQLRAAAPRHGARHVARSSSTRSTCTSPTS